MGFTGPNLNAYAQETKKLEAAETIPSSILEYLEERIRKGEELKPG